MAERAGVVVGCFIAVHGDVGVSAKAEMNVFRASDQDEAVVGWEREAGEMACFAVDLLSADDLGCCSRMLEKVTEPGLIVIFAIVVVTGKKRSRKIEGRWTLTQGHR